MPSRKAHEVAKNPYVSLLFLWKEFERQVTVEGRIVKTSQESSEAYFFSRPRETQLAAHASRQGMCVSSREEIDTMFNKVKAEFEGKAVPFPRDWGGYLVIPDRMEFWQGRPHRLHDRFQYILKEGSWLIDRLSP